MNQKGFLDIILIGIIAILIGGISGYFIYVKKAEAPVSAPESTPKPTEQKLLVVSDQYFSNLHVLDDLDGNDPRVQIILNPDFTFEINKYTAPIRTGDGIKVVTSDSPEWPQIQQELKRANLTNRKTIQIHGKNVVIELLEWHAVAGENPPCIVEGSCSVGYWFKLSVNGYRVDIKDMEERTLLFNDGTRMNMLVGSDVDFAIEILEG